MAKTIHVMQYAVLVLGTFYWSKYTLMDRAGGVLWRQIVASFAAIPMWIVIAYTSTSVASDSTGVVTLFGSQAIGYIGIFMSIIMFVTLVLSIVMWTEEEASEAVDELKQSLPGD